MFRLAAAVAEMETAVDGLARGLEPEMVIASEAMALVKRVARAERQLAGVKMALAGRVADTPLWKRGGHRSPAHWLAGEAGTSVAEAVGVLQTAERVRELPATADAIRTGELSRAQAVTVADAAAVAPEAEHDLLAVAQRESLKGLQDEAARRKVAHLDEQARWDRVHASRHVRFGAEPDGAATMSVRTTTDSMAEIKAAIAHFQRGVFDVARKAGRRDPFEAYAADGLLEMARASLTGGSSKRLPTKVIVRIDHAALARGHAEPGEVCEITGVGSVPVAEVRQLVSAGDAFTAVVATDARGQVTTVAHIGHRPVTTIAALGQALHGDGHDVRAALPSRHASAYQYTALDWTNPTCSVAGCDLPRQQVDHRIDWTKTHHTKLDELDGYSAFHHEQKTRNGPRIEPGVGRRPLLVPP